MAVLEFRESKALGGGSAAFDLSKKLNLKLVVAQILERRGISSVEDALAFISPSLREHMPNPAEMKNLSAAAELLFEAVEKQEAITVYSDYDVDGITSGAQLELYLKQLGAVVDTYVTNRFVDGYGLSDASIRKIVAGNTKVLVTVDCGIRSVNEIAYARKKGLKVIVLDHHEPGEELPPANVVVDPAQDGCAFKEHKLAAAGVVWMLLVLLRQVAKARGKAAANPKDFLDLAAIGTICDMVPLVGVNRMIAHRGVEAIRRSKRVGVNALREVAGLSVSQRFSSGNISYGIGPRINAAGRLGDAHQVLELLMTKDVSFAKKVAGSIDKLNSERRAIENKVKDSCLEWIAAEESRKKQVAYAIYGDDYHVGVIGIAAQRIVENCYRPAAVMGPSEQELKGENVTIVKGSVRTIKGFHVADNLAKLKDLLLSYGGHEAAGGFSLLPENVEVFSERFVELAEESLNEEALEKKIRVDAEISFADIDFDLVDQISKLAPFGVGNPTPLLVSKNVEIISASQLAGKHLRLRMKQDGQLRDGVAWNMFGNESLRKGKTVTMAFRAELNTYKGMSSVQLQVQEVWED